MSIGTQAAYQLGKECYHEGGHSDDCPDDLTATEQECWHCGFDDAAGQMSPI